MLPHSFWTQFLTPEIHQPQLSLLAGRQLLLPPAAVRVGREGGPGVSRLCSPQGVGEGERERQVCVQMNNNFLLLLSGGRRGKKKLNGKAGDGVGGGSEGLGLRLQADYLSSESCSISSHIG